MVTTTSLQPAEEWIRDLKRGFLARGRDFTKHPVINMMCDGQLTLDQLRLWACQQYVIVKPVEEGPERTFDEIPAPWRERLIEGFAEERTGAVSKTASHPALFRAFAEGLGLSREELERRALPLLPTAALVFFFEWAARCRPWYYTQAAGGILEDQVPDTYTMMVKGLREHYKLGPEATIFFDVHIYADRDHGDTASEIIGEYAVTPEIRDELALVANHAMDLLWDMWMIPITYDPARERA
jgi:pyrroloquinoline-quinone synthase